jgi:hypothetical protein
LLVISDRKQLAIVAESTTQQSFAAKKIRILRMWNTELKHQKTKQRQLRIARVQREFLLNADVCRRRINSKGLLQDL